MRLPLLISTCAIVATGCRRGEPGTLTVYATAEHAPTLAAFLATIGDDRLSVEEAEDPVKIAGKRRKGLAVAGVVDLDCGECFQLDGAEDSYTVSAGSRLGLEYGLSALLEALNYRFPHPYGSVLPDSLGSPDPDALGLLQSPQMRRRGLHLHTLHPIEGLDAFWIADDTADAERVIDWTVRNRGNHLQWVALDDIVDRQGRQDAWRAHTAAILDIAHDRGITAGLGIQLFGSGNLQQAFDLLDAPGTEDEDRVAIEARADLITDGLDWDVLNLSFGEFAGESPEDFIATVDLASGILHDRLPDAEMPATVHVGNTEDLRVTYDGQEMLYYFLVKYVAPPVYPWIHTVMYYNLYEDAGLAYEHEDFSEHRAYLLERLSADQPVGYFPESAYWITFDNTVPAYLPLYMRSRWTDMAMLRQDAEAAGSASLDEHVLFSSGWEWGYWQTDAATLRYGWSLPDTWSEPLSDFYRPWGAEGQSLVSAIEAAADAEHDGLIDARLAPYMAGRDAYIDLGDSVGIHSEPDRPSFSELLAADDDTRTAFVTDVLGPLDEMANALQSARTSALAVDSTDRVIVEVQDGLAVSALRARFIHGLYSAVISMAEIGGEGEGMDIANLALAEAGSIVEGRHADLHGPDWILSEDFENPTIYPFGYLAAPNTLCYWRRELAQASNLLRGTDLDIPSCI